MLVIRKAQMDALVRGRVQNFEERLCAYLAPLTARSGLSLSTPELTRQVHLGVASGMRFFSREKDLARYCELVLLGLGGWNGDDHPRRLIDMLKPQVLTAEVRLNNLERWIGLTRR